MMTLMCDDVKCRGVLWAETRGEADRARFLHKDEVHCYKPRPHRQFEIGQLEGEGGDTHKQQVKGFPITPLRHFL